MTRDDQSIPDFPPGDQTTSATDPEREMMIDLAGQILGEHFPVHKVDQMLASMRDLVEFTVVLHQPEENEQKKITMWSTDAGEAAVEAHRSFAHDGWHVSRVARDCTECYGGQWWLDPEASPRPLPFTDEEMWGPGLRGRINKFLGHRIFAVAHGLNRGADSLFSLADRLGR